MTQEFVTLPRDVVENVRGALAYVGVGNAFENPNLSQSTCKQAIWKLDHALRAALEQPQNHVPDAGNMVPAGWKLVPVEPTNTMLDNAWSKAACHQGIARDAWRAMLNYAPTPEEYARHYAAAPKPSTVKDSLTVEQPQSEQPAMTPIAQRKLDSLLAEGYTISGYSIYHEQKHQHGFVTGAGLVGWWKPEGVEYPQPQGEHEPVKLPRFNTWSPNEGDSWYDCPTDAQIIEDVFGGETPVVGAEYAVSAGWHCVTSTYRITWVSEDGDCEAECISHQQENAASQPKRARLTDDQIDAIADAMPGGLEGFMKGWGWRQFARAVIEATHNIK